MITGYSMSNISTTHVFLKVERLSSCLMERSAQGDLVRQRQHFSATVEEKYFVEYRSPGVEHSESPGSKDGSSRIVPTWTNDQIAVQEHPRRARDGVNQAVSESHQLDLKHSWMDLRTAQINNGQNVGTRTAHS